MNYIKSMGKWLPLFFYFLLLALFGIYSYSQIDPNLTLLNNSLWEVFRNTMVNLGYYNRQLSTTFYLVLVAGLFGFHFYFLKNHKKFNLWQIVLPVGILIFSYNFLSHDLFNYMFDAKIFSFYQQNPYLHKALDYPADDWLRFMHWTHRTYPYGPTFLPITLIPSFLALGKLLTNIFFFRLLFFGFYALGVWSLAKINKKHAVFFATSPFVLVEGLMNAHNDLIGVSLVLFGIYLLNKNKIHSRLILLIAAGIKYLNAPFVLITKNKKSLLFYAVFVAQLGLLTYLSITQEVQQWYFLALFGFLPFMEKFVYRLNIFFAGLLLSYYPFLLRGDWGDASLQIKHNIILVALGVFLISYISIFVKTNRLSQ